VRESVQVSLGFSPFELVFGHTPRGPLELLKEALLREEDQPPSVLNHICHVHYKLQKANEFAQNNLKIAESGMKTWCDWKARKRSFQPGDHLLGKIAFNSCKRDSIFVF